MFGSKINILIVEDDFLQQELMTTLLHQYEYVNVAGIAATGDELIQQVTTNPRINALLLDIELGKGRDGMECYSILRFRGINIPAILVTGSVPEASFTYDLGIIDILEKPYTSLRFNKAIEKLRNHMNYVHFVDQGGIFIPIVNDNIMQVPPSDVLFIESNNRCVYVHTINETFETKISLKAYENYLKKHSFLMTHRSYLVNIRNIDNIENEIIYFCNNERTALLVEEKEKELNSYLKNNM